MAVKLNSRAFDHAKTLIKEGKFVADDRDAWSEHQPSSEEENRYIKDHGFEEYPRWHLGFDTKPRRGPRVDPSSPTAISRSSTVVACWPQSPAPASAATTTSSSPSPTYTGCSTPLPEWSH